MPDNNNPVKAFSKKTTIIIVLVLTLLDTVFGVLLLIASFVFVKCGYKGLGMILCIVNVVSPDDVPLIDEVIQIVVVAVTLYNSYNNGDGFVQTIKNVLNSHKEYSQQKNKAMNISQKVTNVINGNQNTSNYTSEPAQYVEMHHKE